MSLLIGIHVQEVLNATEALTAKTGDRIYPLVIPESAPEYPFIVFQASGISEVEGTKDGNVEDAVTVSIAVVSKAYGEAVRLAHVARYALEGKAAQYEEFEVEDCTLVGSSEEYLDEIAAFAVTLNVEFRTSDY